jgi:hypothetical protein
MCLPWEAAARRPAAAVTAGQTQGTDAAPSLAVVDQVALPDVRDGVQRPPGVRRPVAWTG